MYILGLLCCPGSPPLGRDAGSWAATPVMLVLLWKSAWVGGGWVAGRTGR